MLKDFFLSEVKNAIDKAVSANKLGQMGPQDEYSLIIEKPKNADFGDFAVNVSSLARVAKIAPPMIAQNVVENLSDKEMYFSIGAHEGYSCPEGIEDYEIKFDEENKPGISNLISIYCSLTNKSIQNVEEEFKDSNYGTFKKKVADEVEKLILPLQEKYNRYRNSQELYEILEKGSKEATKYASNKIEQVRNKLGIKY